MNPKHYPLNLSDSSPYSIVKKKIFEALSAEYKTIETDISSTKSKHYGRFLSHVRDSELSLRFVVHQNQYTEGATCSDHVANVSAITFVFSNVLTTKDKNFLIFLGPKLKAVRCRITDPADFFYLVKSLPTQYHDILETEFSYLTNPSNFDCVLIHNAISHAKRKIPSLPVLPPKYTEIPNPDIDTTRSTEPNYPPVAIHNHQSVKPKLSVVIPTYNNWYQLRETLLQFKQQTLPTLYFELIVVDDGSNDDTTHKLEPLLNKLGLRSTLLRHPRLHNRERGSKGYSAGIARNYGVKHAGAEIILFQDSDIQIANTMLEDLVELHKTFDVIQGRRFELKKRDSRAPCSYEQFSDKNRKNLEDSVYWGSFYDDHDSQRKWTKQPAPWRFVCSHSLSIKKEHFLQCGRFRTTFCHYGFEDTDLGYRLFKNGIKKFHLYEKPVYHYFQSKSLSEYGNSHWRKLNVLRKSARVFYRNTLDEQVFQHCEPYFKTTTLRTVVRHWLYTILQSIGQYRIFQKFVYTIFQTHSKTVKSRDATPLRHEA